MAKTVQEINEKIRNGSVVVVSAQEFAQMAKSEKLSTLAKEVDIVTTATFGPMCSSGAMINFGHWDPGIRMEEIRLNGVSAYEGLAAVDTYIGATAESKYDPSYGGAHVIEALINGEDVRLQAYGKGTDCYPTKEIETWINKDTVNEFYLFNPRNVYQNYAAATNSANRIKYTYMGSLLPRHHTVTYSTSGELSPLLNDPYLRTIGLGTRIFLGGTAGYVAWNGTQFNTRRERNAGGVPTLGAATLAVIGDAKEMSSSYIKSAYYERYGTSLFVGIGIPIPILDEAMAAYLAVTNEELETKILDYGLDDHPVVRSVTYAELASGSVEVVPGKMAKTAPLSSLAKAEEIAAVLKEWIEQRKFYLSEAVNPLPSDSFVRPLVPKEGGK